MADELSKDEENTDWYVVLGLDSSATDKAINTAFKKMSLVWHPDKNGGSEEAHAKFMKIKEAKIFLLDGKKRKLYDERVAARRKTEALLAERNRTMGKRQRELRMELERREREVAAGGSTSSPFGRTGGLGAGGEARVAAAKLDDLRKRGEAERQRQSADWSIRSAKAKSASAKKRRSSSLSGVSGDEGDDIDLEERTLRVKWKTKKESHSDYTLDMLFSRFGAVQSVSIEEGKGDRALVVFESAASADAAMAVYGDRDSNESMRTSYVGRRRPKRSAFAPRRQSVSPRTPATAGSDDGESLRSFRDHESVVMMNLRKQAERQALMRKMVEDEGLVMDGMNGATTGSAGSGGAATSPGASATTVEGSRMENGGGTGNPTTGGVGATGSTCLHRAGASDESGDVGRETMGAPAPAAANDGRATQSDVEAVNSGTRLNRPAFPVPSPVTARAAPAPSGLTARRRSDGLLPSLAGSTNVSANSGAQPPSPGSGRATGVGSKSVPTTPIVGGTATRHLIDEGDILARMMAMKR